MDMQNKIALVTAAASGAGRAGAFILAREGAAVAVVDQNEPGVKAVAEEIRKRGGRALALAGDLRNDAFSREIVAATVKEFGRLDSVWNHLGIPGPSVIDDLDGWDLSIDLNLRSQLVTTHAALRDVPALLTTDRIVRAGRVTRKALVEWFGIAEPRLALCALNPHAGEQGLFGDEEARVMAPAVESLGITGPLPADTVFVRAMKGEFDAVLAPYHDVGMTAIKVAAFGRGVNITLGLPFVRTSPDHGTAFDIAGTGVADAGSMREALLLAVSLAAQRQRSTVNGQR